MSFKPFRLHRRSALGLTLAVCLSPNWAGATGLYPTAPIKVVVAYAAGGGTDTIGRVIAQSLSTRLGQPVIVDNKPGAGGSLGTAAGAVAAPDGYTFTLGSNGTMVLNPLLYSNIKYQVERDFVPVAGIASIPYLIAANPNVNATDVKGLVELGKTQRLTFASPGNGTTNHLVGVLLESMAKVDMLHVPYRGSAPAMNDVVSGQVNFLSGDLATLMPMVNAGKLKPLGVTGPKRVDALPHVATVAESGFPGFEATGWFGLFAPRGTPPHVIEKISAEMGQVLKDAKVVQRLRDLGGAPLPLNAGQLQELVAAETQKWRKVITDNHVTMEALQ